VTELGSAGWEKIAAAGPRGAFTRGSVEIQLGARPKIRQKVARTKIRTGQCDVTLMPWDHGEFKVVGVAEDTFRMGGSARIRFQLWFSARGAVNFGPCSGGLQTINFGWDREIRRPCQIFGMASGAAVHFDGIPGQTRGRLGVPRVAHEAQDMFLHRAADSSQPLAELEQRLWGLDPRRAELTGTRRWMLTATDWNGGTRGAVEMTDRARVPFAVKSGWDRED